MDPNRDIEKANKIINYHKNKLGLRGTYKLKIEDKFAGKAGPDFLSQVLPNFFQRLRRNITISFDKQYFKELNEDEFTAVLLHEFAHIKNKDFLVDFGVLILLFLLPTFIFGTLFGVLFIVLGLLITLFFIHRRLEYAADKFAGRYEDLRYKDDMISAIEKMELSPSTENPLVKHLLRLSHPSGKDRIKKLKNL